MPTNRSKGAGGASGKPNSGSQGRGNQKATAGSGVSPEVSEAQAELRRDGEPAPDVDEVLDR